jgi:hypothetical protein
VETGLHTKMQPRIAAMIIPADVADASDHDERLTAMLARNRIAPSRPIWLIGASRKPEEPFIGTR